MMHGTGIGMTSQRTRMRMIERLREQGIQDPLVLAAMSQVSRHLFVEPVLQSRAYDDTPLPIGQGQTISSPYIVALTCELACQGRKLDKVLEVGGGCGYQAAVLAKLAKTVFSLERIARLVGTARGNLQAMHIGNVTVRNTDGTHGYAREAPYDAIVVAAAMPTISPELKAQLKPGGRLIAPVGIGDLQQLVLVEAREVDGERQYSERILEAVKFVPLLAGLS
jgi:protein-L-isoaspartate(D-aspartate) O-methyltransferase